MLDFRSTERTFSRLQFSKLGDESAACFDNPEPTPSFPEYTTAEPGQILVHGTFLIIVYFQTDVYENYIPIIDRKAKRYSTSEKTSEACKSLCRNRDCAAWHFRVRKIKQYFVHPCTLARCTFYRK